MKNRFKWSLIIMIFVFIHNIAALSGYDYAEKLYGDKYYDLAVDEYKKFIDDNPQDRRVEKATYKMILCMHYNSMNKRTIAESERFMSKYPDSTYTGDVLFLSANAYYHENVIKNAEIIIRRIELSYKDSSFYGEALMLLADISRLSGDENGYFTLLKKALDAANDSLGQKKLYKKLIYWYYDKKDYEKTAFYLSRMTAEDFDNGEYFWLNGDTLFNLKKNTEATSYFDKLLSRFPQSAFAQKALLRKAENAVGQQQYDQAIQWYTRVITLNPNSEIASEALKRKIDLLFIQKKDDEAIKARDYFLTVYTSGPFYEIVLEDTLLYYKNKKNIDKANAYYDAVYTVYIKNGKIEQARALQQERIDYLRSEGSFKNAIESIIAYIKMYPGDTLTVYMIFTAGRIYGDDLRDFEKSVSTLNEIVYDENYGDQALFYAGFYSEKAERYSDAIRFYEQLIKSYEMSLLRPKAQKRIIYLQKYVMADKQSGVSRLEVLLQEYETNTSIENLHERMADIYAEMKQFDKAFVYYEKRGIKDEKYYRAAIFQKIYNGNKNSVKDYIQQNTSDETRQIMAGIYLDYLIYQDVTENIIADDYEYFIKYFPEYFSQGVLTQYINLLLEKEQFKKLTELVLPETFNDEYYRIYLSGLQDYFKANYGNARTQFEQLYAVKDFPAATIVTYYYGMTLIRSTMDEEAVPVLLQVKNDFTMKVKASIALGGIYTRKANYNDAIFNFSNVLKRKPDLYASAEVMIPYCEALFAKNQTEQLRSELSRINNSVPEQLRAAKGMYLIRIGDTAKGETLLKAIKNEEAQKMLYEFYKERNDWQKIASYFSETTPYGASRKIIALIQLNKIQDAVQRYTTAEKNLKTLKPEVLYYFGNYYYLKAGDMKKARFYIDQIVKDHKDSFWYPRALFVQANLLITEKKFTDAEKAFAELLEKYPVSDIRPDVLLSLGNVAFLKEDYENAAKYMSEAYTLKPSAETAYSLGVVYKKSRKFTEAHEMFKTIVKNYVGSALYYDAFLNDIYTYVDNNEYKTALGLLNELNEKAPETLRLEIQYHIGDCYYGMEDYQNAIREFLKVKYIKTHTDQEYQWMITALFQAGKAYESLGSNDKAVELYEYIIKISGKGTVYEKTAQERIKQLQTY